MRKLNLDSSVFRAGEVLSRSQLKKVLGGYGGYEGPGACTAAVNCGTSDKPRNISCSCTNGGSCTSGDTSVSCTCTGDKEATKSSC